jgi:hypothetical protein
MDSYRVIRNKCCFKCHWIATGRNDDEPDYYCRNMINYDGQTQPIEVDPIGICDFYEKDPLWE